MDEIQGAGTESVANNEDGVLASVEGVGEEARIEDADRRGEPHLVDSTREGASAEYV